MFSTLINFPYYCLFFLLFTAAIDGVRLLREGPRHQRHAVAGLVASLFIIIVGVGVGVGFGVAVSMSRAACRIVVCMSVGGDSKRHK
jgi:hypothetical protein